MPGSGRLGCCSWGRKELEASVEASFALINKLGFEGGNNQQ